MRSEGAAPRRCSAGLLTRRRFEHIPYYKKVRFFISPQCYVGELFIFGKIFLRSFYELFFPLLCALCVLSRLSSFLYLLSSLVAASPRCVSAPPRLKPIEASIAWLRPGEKA